MILFFLEMLDIYGQDSRQIHSRNQSKCSRKMDHNSLCSMFGILDEDFLSDAKVLLKNCSLQGPLIDGM